MSNPAKENAIKMLLQALSVRRNSLISSFSASSVKRWRLDVILTDDTDCGQAEMVTLQDCADELEEALAELKES